jgi:hypothetical protein
MTRIKTGAGWGESKDDGPKHSLTLYNFDVDWAELKEEHKKHLRLRAVPLLQADPTRIAWVTGKASRTGNEEHNLALSNQRAESVVVFLHKEEGVALNRMLRFGVGSSAAKVDGEDAHARSVDVDVTPDGQAHPTSGTEPTIALQGKPVFQVFERSWSTFPNGRIPFVVTIKEDTTRTRIDIRAEGRREVLRRVDFTSGDMLKKGTYAWAWDGYDNDRVLDSALLRSSVLFAYVTTDRGTGVTSFKATPFAELPTFADATVRLASRSVEVKVFVRVAAFPTGPKKPTMDQLTQARRLILEGIAKYWSRNAAQTSPRKIVVGGTDYQVTASAVDDSGRRGAVPYTIEHGIFNDRSCNWGVVLPGWGISYVVPIEDPRDGRETGAHEFGHSVLKDAWGYDYSLRHKGTSTAWQSNIGPPIPGPPAEIDLMKYYNSKDPRSDDHGYFERVNAIEEDVKALIATVRLQFTSDV